MFAYTKEQLEQRGWAEHKGELPNIADKSFSKDILAGSDNELEKIYREKAKRIASLENSAKLLKSFLFTNERLNEGSKRYLEAKESPSDKIRKLRALVYQDYARIIENRKRWKELKGVYSRAIGGDERVDREFLVIATLNDKLKEMLKTDSKSIYLSGYTIRTHTHHDNVGAFDYYLIAHMTSGIDLVAKDGDRIFVIINKLGSYYRLILKNVVDKNEVFVQSLAKSSNGKNFMKNIQNKEIIYKR